MEGPARATLPCRCYRHVGETGDAIMKKIAAMFAVAMAFTTCMAVVTVVTAIA
jgi:hypothetical protein